MKQPVRISIITLFTAGVFLGGCKKCAVSPYSVKVICSKTALVIQDSISLKATASGITPSTSYSWSIIAAPNNAVIDSSTSLDTHVSNIVRGAYTFQLRASDNQGNIAFDTATVIVDTGYLKTITIQPGPFTGQDAEVVYVPGLYDGNGNTSTYPIMRAMEWTYTGIEGRIRCFFKFTALDTLLPRTITNADLSLFGSDTLPNVIGNSYYPGSPYDAYGDNSCWLQRVASNWDEKTITFNNQPGSIATDEIAISPSTSKFGYDVPNINVTTLIKEMTAVPGINYGFQIRLQDEQIYRSMNFKTSNTDPDSSTGPKLVVTYRSLYQ